MRDQQIWQLLRHHSMVGHARYLTNLKLAKHVRNTPGDIVECGVWRGGMIAGIAATLGNHRKYRLFDSFQGLPPADPTLDGAEATTLTGKCAAAEHHTHHAMTLAHITNYQTIKGWFADTLPNQTWPDGIALLRLDADWYEPTTQTLEALFPHVNKGGLIIIDDYHRWSGAKQATHDYLTAHNRPEPIQQAGTPPVAHIHKAST